MVDERPCGSPGMKGFLGAETALPFMTAQHIAHLSVDQVGSMPTRSQQPRSQGGRRVRLTAQSRM